MGMGMAQNQMREFAHLWQTIKTVPLKDVVDVWPAISQITFEARQHPLVLAAGAGRADLVEFLLPRTGDKEAHIAFETSAQRKHLHVLKLFVGLVDPNGNNGQALQWAIYNKDYPMMDFLLTLVNPKDALVKMKPAWGDTEGWGYVNDVMRAKASAKQITAALKDVSGSSKIRKI